LFVCFFLPSFLFSVILFHPFTYFFSFTLPLIKSFCSRLFPNSFL
jgi:hypothetical protein